MNVIIEQGDWSYGPEDNPYPRAKCGDLIVRTKGETKRLLRAWCQENGYEPYKWLRDKDNNVCVIIRKM